jgi:hypothetical protein
MSDTPHFMKKNPENNEKAAKNPLESKKRGGGAKSTDSESIRIFF